MPNVNVKGRYRIYTHDGTEPLPFTSYSSQLCSIRRPNPNTFITISQYVPGSLSPFTTFDPGSSYTIVTRDNTANFSMGPYTRVDRLPSSVTFRSPNFYYGLDKNSITVAISSYALSENLPLSTVFTYIPNQDGYSINSISFDTARYRDGLPSLLTHLTPNSSYQFKTRTPFTFFAPLQSEMGDAFAWGNNSAGEYGMGHRYSHNSSLNGTLSAEQIYGVWDKIVISNLANTITWQGQSITSFSLAALSSCGASKALFVLGGNNYGQLGTGSSQQYYPTWTRVSGEWLDVDMGANHMLAINKYNQLYATGSNNVGQLGLGSGVASVNNLTYVPVNGVCVELAPAWSSTVVRDSYGFIWGCGDNTFGQLGINNRPSPVYTLTLESTQSIWTKVLAYKGIYQNSPGNSTIALKQNKIFGAGLTQPFGRSDGQASTFTQESLGLTDVQDFYVNATGTCIKRTGQNYLFSAGYENINKALATLSSNSTQSYFTKTYIPNNASKLITNINGVIGCLINNQVYKNDAASLSFTPKGFTAIDVHPAQSYSTTLFLLTDPNLRPSPTPTITPTKTPTPTPTPTQAIFPPFNDLSIAIYTAAYRQTNDTNGQQYLYSNTIANINNVFTSEYINNNLTPPGHSMMLSLDYEKSASFNNIVGSLCYPTGNKSRYLVKKIGTNWSFTLLDSSFNTGATYRAEYGSDSFFIAPPNVAQGRTNGVYKFMYVQNRSFYEATSYDRGATWSQNFIETNSSTFAQGNSKKIYARTRNADYKIAFAGVYLDAGNDVGSKLQYRESFPTLGTRENVDTRVGSTTPIAFDFNYDYKNIPTMVSIGGLGSVGVGLQIYRKINGSWSNNTILTSSAICTGPQFAVPDTSLYLYHRYNSKVLSMDFDSKNPDLIYIAYLLNNAEVRPTGLNWTPAGIVVVCYNMATNTIIFNETVVTSTEKSTSSLYKLGRYIDIPKIYYNTSNNTLNLFFFATVAGGLAGTSFYYKKTTRTGTNSWSALTDFLPPNISQSDAIANYWDVITKY